MRSMKTVGLVLAVAGVLMACGLSGAQAPGGAGMGPGFAQHRPPMEQAFGLGGGQFWNNPKLAQQLNLTDDQRKAMDGILQAHRMKLIDLQATLRKAEVAMIPLMKADTPDRGAIEAQIDRVVTARADLEKANARFLLDVRMQLKPDQWKQLQTMRQNRMGHEQMGEHGPGAWGEGRSRPGMGGQFRRPQAPPPAEPPQGAPAPAPAPGSQGPGTGSEQ